MIASFAANPDIEPVVEMLANGAVEDAKAIFEIDLDWSDESIRLVEDILGEMHDELQGGSFSEAQVFELAKTYGSYVGEVFRRNHGATWGIATLDGQSTIGLQQAHTTRTFWPWLRVNSRLASGPADNVWHYYQLLVGSPA